MCKNLRRNCLQRWEIRVRSLGWEDLLEKDMATHSSILAWRIPGTGEPGGLPSMASHRVGHDWSDLASAAASAGEWSKSKGFFPGGSDCKESSCNAGDLGSIPGLGRSPGEGNGNPLRYSCLENPHEQRSLTGYSPWGGKELDITEQLCIAQHSILNYFAEYLKHCKSTILQ